MAAMIPAYRPVSDNGVANNKRVQREAGIRRQHVIGRLFNNYSGIVVTFSRSFINL